MPIADQARAGPPRKIAWEHTTGCAWLPGLGRLLSHCRRQRDWRDAEADPSARQQRDPEKENGAPQARSLNHAEISARMAALQTAIFVQQHFFWQLTFLQSSTNRQDSQMTITCRGMMEGEASAEKTKQVAAG